MAGSLQSDGRWLISLPTATVRPGVYNVLVRATDRVGNEGDYLKTHVEVTSKRAAEAAASTPSRVQRACRLRQIW